MRFWKPWFRDLNFSECSEAAFDSFGAWVTWSSLRFGKSPRMQWEGWSAEGEPLAEVTRGDPLCFRLWSRDLEEQKGLFPSTANQDRERSLLSSVIGIQMHKPCSGS